jgi:hypothetical protein
MAMTTHNLSGRLKKYFESMFQRVEGHTNWFSASWAS